MCPFADTTSFTNSGMNFCIAGGCMAWTYTNEHNKEQCMSSQELPENEKEGYCSLAKGKV